jgi:hypothetical protein
VGMHWVGTRKRVAIRVMHQRLDAATAEGLNTPLMSLF